MTTQEQLIMYTCLYISRISGSNDISNGKKLKVFTSWCNGSSLSS